MISESLAKQNRLQGEYDQLAQDLQTRLDDKGIQYSSLLPDFIFSRLFHPQYTIFQSPHRLH